MGAVLDVVVSVSKDGTVEINKVKRSADEAEKSTNKLSKSTDRLSSQYVKMAKNIAITVAGLYAVKKTVDLITGSVVSFTQTSAMFEKYETTLKSITGSSIKAKESMEWIQDFTATTPFQLEQVTEGFVKMKSYGLDPTDGTLRTLGDTASAMGKDIVQAVEAMADAVTGENERLKEFGVKASKSGDTIAYSWADSSGKARNIVIDNNKDVIQSTLNAIFNEKYVGAMDEQSKTWNGMMSNLSDKWTLFKKDIMDEGLFTYFKAILGVIGDTLGNAFSDAKNGAKAFSDGVIGGIESIIIGAGNMYDSWNGIKFVIASLKIAFFGVVAGIGDGINNISSGWDSMTVSLHNGFKGFVDATGTAFYVMVNKLLEGINTLVNGASSGLGGLFEYIGVSNPFGTINLSVGEYTSKMETAKVKTEDLINTDWSNANLKEAVADADGLLEKIINEDGKNKALFMIDQIKKKVKELTATEVKSNKAKEDAKKLLDKMGAGYGDLGKKSKKAGAEQKKALRDAEKATERLGDTMQSIGDNFANTITGAFGTVGDEVYNFYTTVSDLMAKASAESIAQSQAEGAGATGSAVAKAGSQAGLYGAIAMAGLLAVFGMTTGGTFDSEESAPELGDIGAKTSDTLVNALENILDVQYPMLAVTREMAGYLNTISKAFGGVENSLLRSGVDLGGNLFEERSKTGTLFGGSNTSLYGTSIDISSATMSELMNDQVTAMLDTVTKEVKSTWYGRKKTRYYHEYTDISKDISKYIGEATTSIFNSINSAGETLGISTRGLSRERINLGKMDTTGMNAEQVAEELQGRFSAQVDAITEKYLGVVSEFQRAGEGLGETLYRVITNFDQVSHSLGLIGKSVDWRTANIIEEVSGGLDKLGANMSNYMDNFFSDEEQYKMKLETMTKNFKSLGLAMPSDKKDFKALIDGIDTTTDSGAVLFAELIGLSGAFAEMADAGEALGGSLSDTTSNIKSNIAEISAFLTGQYSFLSGQGKTDYANIMLKQSQGDNPLLSKVEASQLKLESAYNTATTREDFNVQSRYHLGVLIENAEKDATNTDIVETIRDLIVEVEGLRNDTTRASLQSAIV